MDELVALLLLFLHVASLVAAGFVMAVVFSMHRASRGGSFSKTMKIMLVAVVMYFLLELVQLFGLLPGANFEVVQTLFSFLFLLLLLQALLEVRKGVMAYELLVKRKAKTRSSGVE
jgi:hypothetical protein